MQPKLKKVLTLLLCFLLCFEQSGFAQVAGQLDIAGHLTALRNSFISDTFRPLHLRYLSYNPQDNNFQLFLDKGSLKNPSPQDLEDTTKTLLNYFFVGVTLPNDTFWVNLRPDAEDNIIDEQLAQTDVGKIMLETDLQLKKDTAKFTSPEIPEGREYWDKLYKKAGEIFGSENITIPTLTRPWIVPDEIIIRETAGEASGTERSRSAPSAYIYKATLKVMLEQDYLKDSAVYNFKDDRLKELNEYSSQLIREIIIPKLNKEINSSKRYAPLRQVYYSLIMAQWFKTRFQGEQGKYYGLINSQNLQSLNSKEPWAKTFYFKEYQKSFQQGEYNIQEPIYTPYGQTIRSYFSGGISGIAPSIPNLGTTLTDPKTGTASSSIVSPTSPSLNRNVVIGIKVGATDNLAELGKVEIITTASPETAHGDVNTDRIYMEHLEIKPPSVGIIMKQNRERLISHYVKEVSRAYKAREENISDREIIEELQKEIGRLRDKGMEITINIRLEALKRIASERGYRSVEENGMFARKVYEDREDYIRKRRRLQEALRSFLTLKTDPEIAPVYGAVSESGQHVGSAYGYGFITLVIKPNNERTVFFAGDSLIHFDGGENESWKDRIMDFEGALAAMAMKNLVDEKNAEYIVGYASPGLAMLKDGVSWNDPRIVDTFGIGYVEAILFNAVNSTNIQEIRIYLDPIDAFDTIRQVSILIQSFPWLSRKIKMRYHGQLGFIKGLWSWYRTRYNPRDLLTIIGEADDREEQLQEDGWVDDPKAIRTIEEMRDKLVKYSGLSNPNLTDPKLIKMKKQIEALSELTKARHFIDQNMPDLAINELDIVSSTAQAEKPHASSPARSHEDANAAIELLVNEWFGKKKVELEGYGDRQFVIFAFMKEVEGLLNKYFPETEFDFKDYAESWSSLNKFYTQYSSDKESMQKALMRLWGIYNKYLPNLREVNKRIAERLGRSGVKFTKIVFLMEGQRSPMRNIVPTQPDNMQLGINVEFIFDEKNDVFGIEDIAHEAGHGFIPYMVIPRRDLEENEEIAANWAAAQILSRDEINEFLKRQLQLHLQSQIGGKGRVYYLSAAHLLAFAQKVGITNETTDTLKRFASEDLIAAYARFYEGLAWASSPAQDQEKPRASSPTKLTNQAMTPGGIDFRSLPIVTQAVSNLSGMLRDSPLRGQSLLSVNLNEEWQQIERMANSGITPSSERIKEYIQTSCAQDNIIQDRDKILLCISDILRLEEERCDHTNPTLRDILVVLESMRNAQELRQVFLGTIS